MVHMIYIMEMSPCLALGKYVTFLWIFSLVPLIKHLSDFYFIKHAFLVFCIPWCSLRTCWLILRLKQKGWSWLLIILMAWWLVHFVPAMSLDQEINSLCHFWWIKRSLATPRFGNNCVLHFIYSFTCWFDNFSFERIQSFLMFDMW